MLKYVTGWASLVAGGGSGPWRHGAELGRGTGVDPAETAAWELAEAAAWGADESRGWAQATRSTLDPRTKAAVRFRTVSELGRKDRLIYPADREINAKGNSPQH